MEVNNKKNYRFHIRFSFCMLLFVACLTMNVFFCSNHNLYELVDKESAIDTGAISESTAANEGDDNTAHFKELLSNRNKSYNQTIEKSVCSISIIAATSNEISLHLFTVLLFFFLTLFIVLPDGWTLINQKVRLDN